MRDYKYLVFPEKRQVVAIGVYRGKSVRAVAKCAPEDIWDVHTGIDLARLRLDEKILNSRIRAGYARIEQLNKAQNELDRQYAKNENAIEKAFENIEELEEMLQNTQADLEDIL